MATYTTEEQIYVESNVIETQEHLSPSKKYKLIVKTYKTCDDEAKQRSWNYSEGTVYKTSDHSVVGSIRRNYRFYHGFFINQTKEYLITGTKYWSQCFLDLETGKLYDNTDKVDSNSLCWSSVEQLDDRTIVASACFWGGGYNFYFYDVSNIEENGWWQVRADKKITDKYYDDCSMDVKHEIKDNKLYITNYAEYIKLPNGKEMLYNDYYYDYYSDLRNKYDNTDDLINAAKNIAANIPEEETYEKDILKVTLVRNGDHIVIDEIWKSRFQIDLEKERKDVNKDNSNKVINLLNNNDIYKILKPRLEQFNEDVIKKVLNDPEAKVLEGVIYYAFAEDDGAVSTKSRAMRLDLPLISFSLDHSKGKFINVTYSANHKTDIAVEFKSFFDPKNVIKKMFLNSIEQVDSIMEYIKTLY